MHIYLTIDLYIYIQFYTRNYVIFLYFFLNPHLDIFFVESNAKFVASNLFCIGRCYKVDQRQCEHQNGWQRIHHHVKSWSNLTICWPDMFPLFQDMMGNMIIWWEYYTRYMMGIPAICHIISCYLSHTHICSPCFLSKAPQSTAGLGGAGTPHPPWLHQSSPPKVGELVNRSGLS